MFGADEVSSRFPVGLVLAWLGEDGLDLPGPVDDFLSFTVANRFRYYDHPWSGVDSDTIGVALQLLARAPDPERHRPAVEAVLACLARQVARAGTIAVWVTDCDPPSDAPPDIVALGEDCATVAGHLLLGLLGSPGSRQRRTITVGARALLHRVRTVGLAANANYPPAYALATLFRTVDTLQKASLGPEIDALLPESRQALEGDLDRALRLTPATPQEAALLTIACRDAGRLDRVDAGWEARIIPRPTIRRGLAGRALRAGARSRRLGDLVLEQPGHDRAVPVGPAGTRGRPGIAWSRPWIAWSAHGSRGRALRA